MTPLTKPDLRMTLATPREDAYEDLLTACRGFVELYSGLDDVITCPRVRAKVAAAQAAVQKAEQEQEAEEARLEAWVNEQEARLRQRGLGAL